MSSQNNPPREPDANPDVPLTPDSTQLPSTLADEIDEDARLNHFEWRLGKTLERRIDQYLVDRVGYLSRNEVQRLISEGCVTVNGKPTKSSYRPRENDFVRMTAPPPRAQTIEPEDIPLDVLYEDDHMLAINKQTGIIVHPARGVWSGTLVNALVHYGQVHGHSWSNVNGAWRPGILHRLDRNTTGVMLIAKSDEAHWRLSRQFENRTIQKTYLALVQGVPELLGDVIDAPIGHDKFIREKMAVRKIESGAKEAVTRYQVMEVLRRTAPDPKQSDAMRRVADATAYSLVRFEPKTGRTHQIRVHAAHIGHPIVGDTMYGGSIIKTESFSFERQALHAFQISFTHPVTLKPMTLEAPLAPDILELLQHLRGGA